MTYILQGDNNMKEKCFIDDKEAKECLKKLQAEHNTVELIEFIRYDKYHHAFWKCKCLRCDTTFIARKDAVEGGTTRSCGCLHSEISVQIGKLTGPLTIKNAGPANITHGETINYKKPTEYKTWCGIKGRCYNPNEPVYPYYGGRGITVCERWLDKEHGFENFLSDMGRKPTPKHSLDRYPDPNGNYEPSNCRWATDSEQARSTRMSAKTIDYDQHIYWHKRLQDAVGRVVSRKVKTSSMFEEFVGCTMQEFYIYIESQFEPWMNWNNHGNYRLNGPRKWQIDHIIPVNMFDLSIEEDRYRCFNKFNLRPYDALKNREKYGRSL